MVQIVQSAQPFITAIVVALVGLLTTVILGAIKQLQGSATAWFDSRTNASDRETLWMIAQEAFAHAETVWKGYGGEEKLAGALAYASQKLQQIGMNMTPEEIKAAIHDAWLKYDQAQKAAGIKQQ